MNAADAALRSMRAFAAALVGNGVTDICLSPGSRSTPLALAVSREPGLRVHVHLDERSSSFFALGLAKASGRAVGIVTTSGTAVAELLPAVVEAFHARVPLLLLTADRPAELRSVGANQTIAQPGIFGSFVRWAVDAQVPDGEDLEQWEDLAAAAVRRAVVGPPGPVHLNLPFREPLVPTAGAGGAAPSDSSSSGATPPASTAAAYVPHEEVREATAAELDALASFVDGKRGLIHAGSVRHPMPSVIALAEALGWPLVAEPMSGVRVPGALMAPRFLLGDADFLEANRPDVVLQIGAAPTSRAGLDLVGSGVRLAIVDPDQLVADPTLSVTTTVHADPESLARTLLDRGVARAPAGWLDTWRDADARTRAAIDSVLDGIEEPFEGRIARDLAAVLSDGETLLVGSSMPVRDLDAFMAPREGLRVLANRGASGIDGVVSTAFGIAASGARTTALIGDLTFLHDVGGFLWNARRTAPVTFVVLNNGGGGIFPLLSQKDLPREELETLFVTPHGLDLGAMVEAVGARHFRVDRADQLITALAESWTAGRTAVIEVAIDRELTPARQIEVATAVRGVLQKPCV